MNHKILMTLACIWLLCGQGQSQGMQFESGLTWDALLAKARNEGKYIFVDCYATWCGPCKQLARDIFPQKASGDYMNAHFINYSIQMDSTSKDPLLVRQQYGVVRQLMKQYRIDAFPTLLFLSPEGELVYKHAGGFADAASFIELSAKALDMDEQYLFLLNEFNEGKRSKGFLELLLKRAQMARDGKVVRKVEGEMKRG